MSGSKAVRVITTRSSTYMTSDVKISRKISNEKHKDLVHRLAAVWLLCSTNFIALPFVFLEDEVCPEMAQPLNPACHKQLMAL